MRSDQHPPPLIVMGASAGGVEALSTVVGGLRPTFAGGVVVVLHVASDGYSVLPQILDRAGPLPARHATDGEAIEAGVVYVAPPGRHLLVVDGTLHLDAGPAENMARPSIDRLFTSAAEAHGAAVVGVVLSGMLDDGTAGLVAIAEHGGTGVVQDPDEALFPSMPQSAVRYARPRHVVPLRRVAPLLEHLVASSPPHPSPSEPAGPARAGAEAEGVGASADDLRPPPDRVASGLRCPGCAGALWEELVGGMSSYRCRVGHGYSAESLVAAQGAALERALWTAVTALEERAELAGRLAARASTRDLDALARRYGVEADEARQGAATVREVLRGMAAGHHAEGGDGDIAGHRDDGAGTVGPGADA